MHSYLEAQGNKNNGLMKFDTPSNQSKGGLVLDYGESDEGNGYRDLKRSEIDS
jgi:hypothetical protein